MRKKFRLLTRKRLIAIIRILRIIKRIRKIFHLSRKKRFSIKKFRRLF